MKRAEPDEKTPRSRNGRKGGLATFARHGPEFMAEIGRKGGKARGNPRKQ